MRHRFITTGTLVLVLATLACKTYGQSPNATGARALGMAGTGILLNDEYGLFNNPGGLEATALTFIAAYDAQYLGLELNDARIGLVIPFSKFSAGLAARYFGDNLFNQIEVSGVFANKFGFAGLAARINYHQYYVLNYGYRTALTLDMGGLFELSDQLSLGMVIHNLTRSSLMGDAVDPLNTLIELGIAYQPIENFRLDTQISKSVEEEFDFRMGMEYLISKRVAVRTGFSPTSKLGALGIGFVWNNFILDTAGSYQSNLGFSASLSLKVSWVKK